MPESAQQFVNSFRNSAPYIRAHRGRTFVLYLSGETLACDNFASIVHDIALLNSLGIRLVLVHGARPQIEHQLEALKIPSTIKDGQRITDRQSLAAVEQAVGQLRLNLESRLSMGLINTPMSGSALQVVSGNFVTAKPYGIRNGTDYGHTGDVRKINTRAITHQLDLGNLVLLTPIAHSLTGEAFNCRSEDVAMETAIALKADKLILVTESDEILGPDGETLHQLSLLHAEEFLSQQTAVNQEHLRCAIRACKKGVNRAHMISHIKDGALLLELFTRDGTGTLITTETYEGLRHASIHDVGGILELITPLEQEGILVRRSREQLELEIDKFSVIERDGMIIACAAVYIYEDGMAELACLATHENYRNHGRGEMLLQHLEQQCHNKGVEKLFLLTTHTAHWFIEKGFVETDINTLPIQRRELYNVQRNSRVFCKTLA